MTQFYGVIGSNRNRVFGLKVEEEENLKREKQIEMHLRGKN